MSFASPPDRGAFDAAVYRIVARIPRGRVMTYGQIATFLDRPAGVSARTYAGLAARWVGSAMARAPEFVPWQRVINSQGRVSARPGGEDGEGTGEQRRLLEQEGVLFDVRGRVDLACFGYAGPGKKARGARRAGRRPATPSRRGAASSPPARGKRA